MQRLDQRRTQPVGLVDGHRFQSRSARLPKTIVQRFALLDQLQTRYGVRDHDSGTSRELTFATLSLSTAAEQSNTFTSVEAIATQAPITTPSVTSAGGHSPPAQTFRVSRKAVPFASQSDLPSTTSAKQEFPQMSSLGKHSAIAHSSASSSQLHTVQNLVANPGTVTKSSPVVILRKEINNHTTELSASDSATSSHLKDLSTIDETPQQEAISTNSANTPLVLQKATTEQSEEIQQQPILTAKPLTSDAPLVLRKAIPVRQDTPLGEAGGVRYCKSYSSENNH